MTRFYHKVKYLLPFLLIGSFIFSQEINGDAANGYSLFKKNCSSCHEMDRKLTGPALGGVVDRLAEKGLGRDWLQKWIKNNKELRESGDAYANQIFNEFGGVEMTLFPDLAEQDIDDILAYTTDPAGGEAEFKKKEEEKKINEIPPTNPGSGILGDVGTGVLIIGFGVLAVLLIILLFKINALAKAVADPELKALQEKEALGFLGGFAKVEKIGGLVMGVLGILAFYGVWSMLLGIGVDKGYKPEQPVYFSHKIHAGEQGVDCQYCHSSARYSKTSGIPSTNVCMNCHKVIKEYGGEYVEEGKTKDFYTNEIQKIYQAIGWDPSTQQYSGEHDPIKWVRIHNMPDFVYFNHQQHVVAGEKAILKAIDDKTIPNYDNLNLPASGGNQVCYACHGNVSEMNEVEMANTFTMGWCLECHRTTEVDMGNAYNAAEYKALHEKLKNKYNTEEGVMTVSAIGGMECGKCHY